MERAPRGVRCLDTDRPGSSTGFRAAGLQLAADFDEALEIANGTEYGLTGGLISSDRDRIERAKREFHVGNLYVNRKITGALVYPAIMAMVALGLVGFLMVAVVPKIVASFSGAPLPPPMDDTLPDDPFAAYRDFEYSGPELGGGGGLGGAEPPQLAGHVSCCPWALR